MKQLLFGLLVFLNLILVFGQTQTNQNVLGKYRLNWIASGFFPADDLLFEKTAEDGQYVFEFKEDGSFVQHLTAETFGECPVGVFVLEKGFWNLEKGKLSLKMKGEKLADYTFEYEIVYQIKKEKGKLRLLVDKILTNKEVK
ncbi:hypothetical protein [Croceivirga radicis]|uniref:hypothetical protein n=1 Tax=Croceivirga radicis TaxID=1929488 RepID=UPI000255ADC1|nr:hypothetical protein [Croceivirga radicis]